MQARTRRFIKKNTTEIENPLKPSIKPHVAGILREKIFSKNMSRKPILHSPRVTPGANESIAHRCLLPVSRGFVRLTP